MNASDRAVIEEAIAMLDKANKEYAFDGTLAKLRALAEREPPDEHCCICGYPRRTAQGGTNICHATGAGGKPEYCPAPPKDLIAERDKRLLQYVQDLTNMQHKTFEQRDMIDERDDRISKLEATLERLDTAVHRVRESFTPALIESISGAARMGLDLALIDARTALGKPDGERG